LGDPFLTDFRKSLRTVARGLGVDELTVRNRLQRMRKTGFVTGWRILVNPTLSGVNIAQLLVEVDNSAKETLIRKLRGLPDVVALVVHLGSSMYVVPVYHDEKSLARQIQIIENLADRNLTAVKVSFPKSELKLTRSDFQIVRAISCEPRKMYSTVATDLGFSTKTVRRRFRRLVEGKALFAVPSTDPTRLEGAIYVDMLVIHSGHGATKVLVGEVASKLDDVLIRSQIGDPRHSFFNLILSRVSAIPEISRLVKSIPGVEDVRIDVVQERLEMYDRYLSQLDSRFGVSSNH